MTEPIFQRVGRIISAKLEDAVDRMEVAGHGSLVRETIREVDRSIEEHQAGHESAVARRLQAARQQAELREAAGELTAKARFALAEGRPDLAEAAINRQMDLEAEADLLRNRETSIAQEEARLGESLAALKARKQQMEEEMENYLAARLELAMSGQGTTKTERQTLQDIGHAEQAFKRVMAGAGAASMEPAAGTGDHIAEIDAMQKKAEVAARLAALK